MNLEKIGVGARLLELEREAVAGVERGELDDFVRRWRATP